MSKIEAKTTTSFSIFYHSPISRDKDYADLRSTMFYVGERRVLTRVVRSIRRLLSGSDRV